MISLVYKIKNNNTQKDVILKVKRKNIEKKLDNAINKLLFTISIISYLPYFNTLNIPNVIQKNIMLLKEQLDFHKEIYNTKEMSYNCKDLKYVKIPEIYEEVTNIYPNAIMMEYIDGVNISKLEDSDYDKYAELVLKFGFVTIINGLIHGDLHAGNILFIKNNNNGLIEYKIGIIDFGIVIRLNKKITTLCLDIATNLFTEPGKSMAQKILKNIIEPQDIFNSISDDYKENLYTTIGDVLDEIISNSIELNQSKIFSIIKIFNNCLNNNNNKLYICDDFVKIQMAIVMAHSASMCLCKNDYITFTNKVINDLFHTDLFMKLDE